MRRARLLAALDRVLVTRLGLVVAPPGAGKTTLMAHWAHTVAADVAWLRVEREDVAPGRLVDRLSQALGEVLDLPSGASSSEELAVAIERRTAPLVLVLDDLHTIAGSPAEAVVERLLLLAPVHLHVLMGSRRRPGINLVRSELPTAVHVTGEDLAMRAPEVQQLFRDVYAVPLGADDAAALARRTAGWPAGLHLFHLATATLGATERRTAVAALAQRSRYAEDYLAHEVLQTLPGQLRRFLTRTSVLETLTAERCDALLGTPGTSRRLLTELERLTSTVTRDGDGVRFRCHEAVRRHLETQLQEQLGSTQATRWWQQAARVCEQDGAPAEALRLHALARDWDAVRRLLHVGGMPLVRSAAHGLGDLLPVWLQEDDPWASLVFASRLLEDGSLTTAAAVADRARTRLVEDPVGSAWAVRVAAAARTWLPGAGREPAPEDWVGLLREATRRAPQEAAGRAGPLDDEHRDLVRGLALVLAGNLVEARPLLEECVQRPHADVRTGLTARLALATLDALGGPGPLAGAALDRVVSLADRHGLGWWVRVAHGVAVALVPTPGVEAEKAVDALVEEADRRGDPWGAAVVASAAVAAQLRAARLPPAQLDRGLDELCTRWRALDAGVLEAWARSLHAVVAATGDLPNAEPAAESAEAFARAAGVPGALWVAYGALALSRPAERDELLELASASASASGFGPRPAGWEPALRVVLDPLPGTVTAPEPAGLPAAGLAVVRPGPEPAVTGPFEVRCFEEFRLLVSGVPVGLSRIRPRARSLLRLLALHTGRLTHREQLADTLWGELDPSAALHGLQVALSSLRTLLGSAGVTTAIVVRDGDAYGLVLPEGSSCDLHVFDGALAAAARARSGPGDGDRARRELRAALDVYTGELMPEEGPAEWVVSAREQYRVRAAEAAATLAALELARGDATAAASAATRGVEIDPYRDDAWRALIEASRLAGDHATAGRAQRRYDEVLAGLGLPPTADVPVPAVPGGPREPAAPDRAHVRSSPGTRPRPATPTRPRVPGTPRPP
ncbi:BTAD domain-containing putative transcriptional regulator [Cellulomonas sp. NS3]|uniref:BTAD domain-containing putative transcriptional regulator n=1 Tax=Cellulomonas sp. NS3 TaxID=2973977 RepID=UPI002163D13D|nr:BTAD domain-containing putative transcriptional regulator [Cellulomonas sp. NS3]